jgi:hypothetical protein
MRKGVTVARAWMPDRGSERRKRGKGGERSELAGLPPLCGGCALEGGKEEEDTTMR